MRYFIGLMLIVVGAFLGLFGDYPFDALMHQSVVLVAVGGILVGAGIAWLILGSGGRGNGRHDEPSSYIRP